MIIIFALSFLNFTNTLLTHSLHFMPHKKYENSSAQDPLCTVDLRD